MALNDPLGDMLTRIRNAQAAQKAAVTSPASRLRENVLEVLAREGYIRGYNREEGPHGALSIELRQLKRVSRPGRRVYSGVKDLPRVYNGLGIAILSTPRGVMSDSEAREAHVGGEILCTVF
jgi:small subunit ribosomal protein S8